MFLMKLVSSSPSRDLLGAHNLMDSFTRKELDKMYIPAYGQEERQCEAHDVDADVSDEVHKLLLERMFVKTVPVMEVVDELGDQRGGSYAYNPKTKEFQCVQHDTDPATDDDDDDEEEQAEKKRMRMEHPPRVLDFGTLTLEEAETFDCLCQHGEDMIERIYWIWLHYRLCGHRMFDLTN